MRPPPAFYHHIPEEKRYQPIFTMNKATSENLPRRLLPKVSPGKCTGPPSCETCVYSGRTCVFEPSKDRRRKEALRYAEKIFKSGADQDVRDLVDRMKQSSSINDSLAELQEMTH
ncbi:uncharacterized protein BO87DRAFT_402355 [Aspergillus neoniger CBS 115656]|uniref:Zn(2)-C6 fungal-type domain-containing protein n=1 Tax=Aspergillus neoniger (strain CBS 115656) TaxID=1448310 RepID=A0A318Y7L7_ASPNB|nr:hypothetical protein BO87DRAFT_402355 [Aspergillus neoniger CBS 115656]PYH28313.1 hypothetical protein BO87DRAFT_402355 [Aspergillus neoniger CBS 115656]